jgi:hypothetical protein
MDIDYCNHIEENVCDDHADHKELNEPTMTKTMGLHHQYILECQKRKEKGNEEFQNGNYGKASFEYKIGLSYIQEYEKILLSAKYDDNKNHKFNQ